MSEPKKEFKTFQELLQDKVDKLNVSKIFRAGFNNFRDVVTDFDSHSKKVVENISKSLEKVVGEQIKKTNIHSVAKEWNVNSSEYLNQEEILKAIKKKIREQTEMNLKRESANIKKALILTGIITILDKIDRKINNTINKTADKIGSFIMNILNKVNGKEFQKENNPQKTAEEIAKSVVKEQENEIKKTNLNIFNTFKKEYKGQDKELASLEKLKAEMIKNPNIKIDELRKNIKGLSVETLNNNKKDFLNNLIVENLKARVNDGESFTLNEISKIEKELNNSEKIKDIKDFNLTEASTITNNLISNIHVMEKKEHEQKDIAEKLDNLNKFQNDFKKEFEQNSKAGMISVLFEAGVINFSETSEIKKEELIDKFMRESDKKYHDIAINLDNKEYPNLKSEFEKSRVGYDNFKSVAKEVNKTLEIPLKANKDIDGWNKRIAKEFKSMGISD